MSIQTDFFLKNKEDLCLYEVSKLKEEIANTRRGMFARHGELYKAIADMQKVIDLQQKEIAELKHDKKVLEKII